MKITYEVLVLGSEINTEMWQKFVWFTKITLHVEKENSFDMATRAVPTTSGPFY